MKKLIAQILLFILIPLIAYTFFEIYKTFVKGFSARKVRSTFRNLYNLKQYDSIVEKYQKRIASDKKMVEFFDKYFPPLGLSDKLRNEYNSIIKQGNIFLNNEVLIENIEMVPENIRAGQITGVIAGIFLLTLALVFHLANIGTLSLIFLILGPIITIWWWNADLMSFKDKAERNQLSLQIDFEKFFSVFYHLFREGGKKPSLELVINSYKYKAEEPFRRLLTELSNNSAETEYKALNKLKNSYNITGLMEFCVYCQMALNGEDVSEQLSSLKNKMIQTEENRLEDIIKSRLIVIDLAFMVIQGGFLLTFLVSIYLILKQAITL